MPELTLENIERISREVRRQEITFSHLAEELIDHICCDVEEEMETGLNFSEAYRKVRQKIGPRRLKEIQEETLYAIDTKYRFMKNTMKFSGVAGTILFGFAAMFKIQHWPGAGIMLTLGALILAFVFMPSALGVLWKETHSAKKLFLFISAFLSVASFIAGVLFKVQHWEGAGVILILNGVFVVLMFIPALLAAGLQEPERKLERPVYMLGAIGLMAFFTGFIFKIMHWSGAAILLVGGLLLIFIIVLPWYTWLKWKDEKYIRPEFIFLIIGSLSIILPSALMNLNLQLSFDKGFNNNLEEQRALFNYMDRNEDEFIASYHDSLNYTRMLELKSRTGDLLNIITSVETKMISESEGGPGTELQKDLEAAMTEYGKYLSSVIPPDSFKEISQMIDPSTYLVVSAPGNKNISTMVGLHSLAVMKNSFLTAEQYVLRQLAGIK